MRGKLRLWLELRSILDRSARWGRRDPEAREAFSIVRISKQSKQSKRCPITGCSMRRKPSEADDEASSKLVDDAQQSAYSPVSSRYLARPSNVGCVPCFACSVATWITGPSPS